jgi:hypothetical protein
LAHPRRERVVLALLHHEPEEMSGGPKHFGESHQSRTILARRLRGINRYRRLFPRCQQKIHDRQFVVRLELRNVVHQQTEDRILRRNQFLEIVIGPSPRRLLRVPSASPQHPENLARS